MTVDVGFAPGRCSKDKDLPSAGRHPSRIRQ